MARILFAGALSLAFLFPVAAGADVVLPAPVTLCLAATCDMEPVYPTRTIPSDAPQVAVVIRLGKDDPLPLKLNASWVILETKNQKTTEREMSHLDLEVPATRRCTFALEPRTALATGKYRLDIQTEGKPWQTLPFEVVPPAKAAKVKLPADLLPLKEGTVWTYNYIQETAGGMSLEIPGVTPDKDGNLRTTLTMTIGKADPKGAQLDFRLNGRLSGQELWQPTEEGLMILKRGMGVEAVSFQPPLMFLPFPLRSRTWNWSFGTAGQHNSATSFLWGQLPINGPQGPTEGYIVLTQQKKNMTITGNLRHDIETDTVVEFIPGVGIVRQLHVSTVDGEMTRRVEMTLAPQAAAP